MKRIRTRLIAAVVLIGGAMATTALSASAAPGSAAHPSFLPLAAGHARPPIRYAEVPAPARPDKPGHGPTTSSVTYPPSVIQTAYDFPTSTVGMGETITVVDAYGDPTLQGDLKAFDTKFAVTATTVTISYPDGAPTSTNSNWAVETALDVEWAHANAPDATIDLVVTPDASFQHLLDGVAAAINLKPAAVSMSWGDPESYYAASSCTLPGATSSVTETCQIAFEAEFASVGTTALFASSGDQGAYDGTHPKTLTVNYPASSPEVIGVGGTTLNVSSTNTWSSEAAWSSSGGGYSTLFGEPGYQTTTAISDSSSMRGVPDVAFDANPSTGVYVYEGGLWYSVGGTSVGSPNWAAVAADAASSGKTVTLGGLYGLYGSGSSYSADFHDITSGNNGYYSAGTGWDAVTGIGTPQVGSLIGL